MTKLKNASTLGNAECPKIYVACLASYNNGKLYGTWIDAMQSEDEIQDEIQELLANSPIPCAEEWAIHDHEGFYSLTIDENETIADVSEKAWFIKEYGELGVELVNCFNGNFEYASDAMKEYYQGEYKNELDYAMYIFDELYLNDIPEKAQPYVDYEKFKRDIFIEDYFSIEVNGSSHIFANH